MPTGFYQMKTGYNYQLTRKERREKEVEDRKRARRQARLTPTPKQIPKFNPKTSKGFRTDTQPNPRGNQNTKNPTRQKRAQDFASDKRIPAGQYIITPAGAEFKLAVPRADKGKKRGPRDKSRRASIGEARIPESLGYKSQRAQEGIRAKQGGVRAFGQSLEGSMGNEPIGGWNGMNVGQLNPSKSKGRKTSTRSSELQEDIKQKKQDIQYKVTKLDHPDNDPKKYNDSILNDLAIRRIANRQNISRDEAEEKWFSKTEQEKLHLRNQELQSSILERENERKVLEGELEKLAGLEIDLEEELAELDAPILTEAGGSLPSGSLFSGSTHQSSRLSTEETRKQAEFRAKLKLMREFGQIDEDTAEGKGRLFALIDEASHNLHNDGLAREEGTTAEQDSGPIKSVPIKKGTPLTGQTLRRKTGEDAIPEGPFRKMKIDDLRRAEAQKAKREKQKEIRKEFGDDENIDGFATTLRNARLGVVNYFTDEWNKAKNKVEEEREEQRRGESLNPAQPSQLVENARRQEAEKKEARRQNKLALRQKAKEYGQLQSDYNRREEAVENVAGDLVDSILNRMTFPAEVEAQENRREVGRERRRQRGAEIFKSADKVEIRDLGEEEDKRQDREKLRKLKQNAVSKNLAFKLKNEDPRFMSDDDLEAKAKSVQERLRDEERRKETERKWDEVIFRSDERDRELAERPSNVVSFSTDTEEEEPEEEDDDFKAFVKEYHNPTQSKDTFKYEPPDEISDTSSVREAQEDFLAGIEEPTPADLGKEKAQKEIKQIKAKVVRDLINPLQKTNRYQNAEHFGASGMSPERIEALRRMKDKAEKDKENKRERLTENLRRQIGIKEKAERKGRPSTTTQTEALPVAQVQEAQAIRQQPLPAGQQPIIAERYQRGSTREFLSDKELSDLDNMKLRLAQIKGELQSEYGFPRRLVDSKSKKDRGEKDIQIAKKLSELRNNPRYQEIQEMIAEAIRLSQNINKLTVKGSQLKKKKK